MWYSDLSAPYTSISLNIDSEFLTSSFKKKATIVHNICAFENFDKFWINSMIGQDFLEELWIEVIEKNWTSWFHPLYDFTYPRYFFHSQFSLLDVLQTCWIVLEYHQAPGNHWYKLEFHPSTCCKIPESLVFLLIQRRYLRSI